MTKSVTTWSDAPNGQQCGLHDNGDNGVRNEFTAVQDAFETTCPVSRNIALAWLGIGLGFTFAHLSPIRHPTHFRPPILTFDRPYHLSTSRVSRVNMQANTALGVRADKDTDTGSDDGTSELSLKPSSLSTTRQRVRFSAVPPQFLPVLLALTSPPSLNSVGAATVPVTMSVTTLSQFVPVSEGTLVTAAGNDWYKTAQWSGMANDGTTQSVAQVLAVACLAAPSCVGFHLIGGDRLGEGALLYDSDGYSGTWPPETPDAVAAAGGSWRWGEAGWSGRGEPAAHGSVEVSKGWNTWEAFRRVADPRSVALLVAMETQARQALAPDEGDSHQEHRRAPTRQPLPPEEDGAHQDQVDPFAQVAGRPLRAESRRRRNSAAGDYVRHDPLPVRPRERGHAGHRGRQRLVQDRAVVWHGQ